MAVTFCRLTDGQKMALMNFIRWRTPGCDYAQKLINARDWKGLYQAVSINGTPPYTEADLATIGNMSTGLQNANFILFLMDVADPPMSDADKQKMVDALGTHCYNKIAGTICENLTDKSMCFPGDDLRNAYAPGDTGSCPSPNAAETMIITLIQGGKMVAHFFSSSLPDFMTNTFPNWVKADVGGFFVKVGGTAFQSIKVPGIEISTQAVSGMNETATQASKGMNETVSQASSGMSKVGKIKF